jgi:non-specific serine/threonine protein kinase
MAAAEALVRTVGASTVVLPHLQVFHDQCERSAREALGAEEFEAARQEGLASNFDEAVAHAMVV